MPLFSVNLTNIICIGTRLPLGGARVRIKRPSALDAILVASGDTACVHERCFYPFTEHYNDVLSYLPPRSALAIASSDGLKGQEEEVRPAPKVGLPAERITLVLKTGGGVAKREVHFVFALVHLLKSIIAFPRL